MAAWQCFNERLDSAVVYFYDIRVNDALDRRSVAGCDHTLTNMIVIRRPSSISLNGCFGHPAAVGQQTFVSIVATPAGEGE